MAYLVGLMEFLEDIRRDSLDSGARALLDLVQASGRPPLHTLGADAARAAVRASQQLLGKDPPPARREERTLAAPGRAIPLRLYRPSGAGGAREPLPLFLFLHGGGWMLGDLDYGAWFCASLAENLGIAVAALGYRLAPEHPFPAGFDDCLAALEQIVAQADALGIDADRIAIGGDSAGGNLAAACALEARDRGLRLRAQILLYPVTDLVEEFPSYTRNGDGFGLTADAMRWFRDHYLAGADPDDWRVSPLRAAGLAGVAPAFVTSCGFDPLCDEADAYATRLAEAGVAVRHIHYAGQIHGFLMWPKLIDKAEDALREVADELRIRLAHEKDQPVRNPAA